MTEGIAPTPFQARVLLVPEEFDLFLGGGRGGAKSFALGLLALRHLEQYGDRAHALYVRKTYQGLLDFEQITRQIFNAAYGSAARFNGASHVWRLPSGGTLELGQLDGPQDYAKYQGRSFTLLSLDEASQHADMETLDLLRSNLRGRGVPTRTAIAANPGGVGHQTLAERFALPAKPWVPHADKTTGRQFVSCPSTLLDNPHIDQAAYRKQLAAACSTDPELLASWLDGSWLVSRGAYFQHVLSVERNMIEDWHELPSPSSGYEHLTLFQRKQIVKAGGATVTNWDYFLAHDFGVSAPSVTFLCGRSPGANGPDGRWYPRNSIVLIDEWHTADPERFSRGLGFTVPQLAAGIRQLCGKWSLKTEGCADDSIFANTGHSGAASIAEDFLKHGVTFHPARKADRWTGWERLRRLMQDAGKPDVPGLYAARRCEGFWRTVPSLARDERRPDDVDTAGNDHWADAVRYACGYERPQDPIIKRWRFAR